MALNNFDEVSETCNNLFRYSKQLSEKVNEYNERLDGIEPRLIGCDTSLAFLKEWIDKTYSAEIEEIRHINQDLLLVKKEVLKAVKGLKDARAFLKELHIFKSSYSPYLEVFKVFATKYLCEEKEFKKLLESLQKKLEKKKKKNNKEEEIACADANSPDEITSDLSEEEMLEEAGLLDIDENL